MSPSEIRAAWEALASTQEGRQEFSRMVGAMAPYSGTIRAEIEELRPGYARVRLDDRPEVRNHLQSVHAVALLNLGEMATGLATLAGLADGGRGIITELGMRYAKKARGSIVAEASTEVPGAAGEHDHEVVGVLRDGDGEPVAEIRACWRLEVPA